MSMSLVLSAVVVAEALSSNSPTSGIQSGFRMFTIYTSEEVCARQLPVSSLVSEKVLRVKNGELFSLDSLVIVARDMDGAVVPRIPMTISDENENQIALRVESTRDTRYRAVERGLKRFNIRALCPGYENVQVDVVVRVE